MMFDDIADGDAAAHIARSNLDDDLALNKKPGQDAEKTQRDLVCKRPAAAEKIGPCSGYHLYISTQRLLKIPFAKCAEMWRGLDQNLKDEYNARCKALQGQAPTVAKKSKVAKIEVANTSADTQGSKVAKNNKVDKIEVAKTSGSKVAKNTKVAKIGVAETSADTQGSKVAKKEGAEPTDLNSYKGAWPLRPLQLWVFICNGSFVYYPLNNDCVKGPI